MSQKKNRNTKRRGRAPGHGRHFALRSGNHRAASAIAQAHQWQDDIDRGRR